MDVRQIIGRLLAVFVIIGLVTAPLAAPVAAKPVALAGLTDASAMSMSMSTSAMSDDMPCCPDSGAKTNGCQDCPLIALCMLTIAQAQPSPASGLPAPLPTVSLIPALDDLIGDGLVGAPPDHPPRISI